MPEEPCTSPPPGSIDGPALIAVETTLGAGLPILFLGHASTPAIAGAPHVALSYRALDATDRKTTVGDLLTAGPFPIAEDGAFEAELPSDTLAGSANPILPGVPITSQLTLTARICGIQSFYCGTVTGNVTSPVQGTLAGRFGLTMLESKQEIPREPRYGCAPEDRAVPLGD